MARERVDWAVCRREDGRIDLKAQWHESHQHLPLARALELAADIPPVDRLVVCHGDACAPNTLLTDDGRWSGHVDLGQLGVADRWADLADRHLEHGMELRARMGRRPARRVRDRSRPGADPLLPPAVGSGSLTRDPAAADPINFAAERSAGGWSPAGPGSVGSCGLEAERGVQGAGRLAAGDVSSECHDLEARRAHGLRRMISAIRSLATPRRLHLAGRPAI